VVKLNGQVVPCDPDQGWNLINERQFQLFGSYCDQLLNTPGATIESSFPCGAVIII
jgi:hypothetical protein